MTDHGGFSLAELLLTTAIAALLLGLGVPNFRSMLLDARLSSAVNQFVHAVHGARHEAHKRSQAISICPSHDGLQCSANNDWSKAWLLFANPLGTEPPRVEHPDNILLVEQLPSGITARSNRRAYSFRPFSISDTNGTVGFCDHRGAAHTRAVVISPTGRPRLIFGAEAHTKTKCQI